MEILNDDCVFYILKLLDLCDQISLYKAIDYLKEPIEYFWQNKFIKLDLNFYELNLSDQDLHILLTQIAKILKFVRIKRLTVERFDIIKQHKYPILVGFRFEHHSNFLRLKDEHMKIMTEIFPNLRIFSPHGAFTGQYIELFTHLEELTLSYCQHFRFKYLQKIMENLKNLKVLKLNVFEFNEFDFNPYKDISFDKLEQIYLDSWELQLITYGLIRAHSAGARNCYNNLKELTIADNCEIENLEKFVAILNKTKAQHLLEAEFANCTAKQLDFWIILLETYTNLRKLTFNNVRIINFVRNGEIFKKTAPSLREFYIVASEMSVDMLENFLKTIPQLSLLSITHCNFNTNKIEIDVNDVIKDKTKMLTLNFINNYLTNSTTEIVRLFAHGQSPLFVVTRNPVKDLNYEPIKLTFQQVPTNDN